MLPTRTDAVLLTGATGLVGSAVLARLLGRTERPVVALVRARDDAAAAERLRDTLREVGMAGEAGRCTAVAAELEHDDLGLSLSTLETLARRCDEVIHCGASVSFAQPLDDARAVNVGGAARVTELAERAAGRGEGLRRFAHVSTAYVAGEREGTFGEDDRSRPRGWRNTYEQTKHEAEGLLRAWSPDLPLQVVRPSIVVGDRRTGWTRSFNVLYWPLRQFAAGRMPVVPALPEAPVDVVPVDYVADAVLELAGAPAGTYHVVAGERASTVGEVIDLACARFDAPAPAIVAPQTIDDALAAPLRPSQRRALERARVFFPYFSLRVRFDDRWARQALAPAGVAATRLAEYFDTLMDYAERTRWGRRARLHAVA